MSFSAGRTDTSGRSTTTLDPQLSGALYGAVDRAKGLADRPFEPYSGTLVAPFTPAQQQGQQALTEAANGRVGAAPVQSAIGVAERVGDYRPQAVTAQPLTGMDVGGYMNPYAQDVIDASMADLSRRAQIQDVVDASRATAAGAFGGSRAAVLQNLDRDSFARAAASTVAGLRQANYAQAQQAALADLARKLAADQGNQAAGLQAAGVNLGAANALAGLGGEELDQALQRAGALNAAGGTQQQNQQAALDAAYQQWQMAQQYPVQMQQLLNQTVGVLPQYGSTETSGREAATGLKLELADFPTFLKMLPH